MIDVPRWIVPTNKARASGHHSSIRVSGRSDDASYTSAAFAIASKMSHSSDMWEDPLGSGKGPEGG